LLDAVKVVYHGSPIQLNKLALIATEKQALLVRPYDPGDTHAIEQAIVKSGLGLTTQVAKTVIRVPIPPLSQDRRNELARAARALGESARVAMRNIRRDTLRASAALGLSDDMRARLDEKIESLVKQYITAVDDITNGKVAAVTGG
jgi:ribosome recycling factor